MYNINMSAITLDTYQFVDLLKAKGFTEQQAKGLLNAVEKIDTSKVATKEDLAALENNLRNGLKDLQVEMYRFVVTALSVQTGIIALIFSLFNTFG